MIFLTEIKLFLGNSTQVSTILDISFFDDLLREKQKVHYKSICEDMRVKLYHNVLQIRQEADESKKSYLQQFCCRGSKFFG